MCLLLIWKLSRLRKTSLNAGQRENEGGDDKDDRGNAGDALELLFHADAAPEIRGDAAADRAGQTLLLGGLNGQKEDKRDGREDEQSGKAMGEPGSVLRDGCLRDVWGAFWAWSCCCSCC